MEVWVGFHIVIERLRVKYGGELFFPTHKAAEDKILTFSSIN